MSISENMGFTDREGLQKAFEYIDENMKPSRLEHTRGVVRKAEDLAVRYGADREKTRMAAWLHDIAKTMSTEELDREVREHGLDDRLIGRPNLSHSKVAALMIREHFGISDDDIINAVAFHTTARAGMSTLEKIIFLADAIEDGRDYPGVEELRRLAESDLDQACLKTLEKTIVHVNSSGDYLDPDTLKARDWFKNL